MNLLPALAAAGLDLLPGCGITIAELRGEGEIQVVQIQVSMSQVVILIVLVMIAKTQMGPGRISTRLRRALEWKGEKVEKAILFVIDYRVEAMVKRRLLHRAVKYLGYDEELGEPRKLQICDVGFKLPCLVHKDRRIKGCHHARGGVLTQHWEAFAGHLEKGDRKTVESHNVGWRLTFLPTGRVRLGESKDWQH